MVVTRSNSCSWMLLAPLLLVCAGMAQADEGACALHRSRFGTVEMVLRAEARVEPGSPEEGLLDFRGGLVDGSSDPVAVDFSRYLVAVTTLGADGIEWIVDNLEFDAGGTLRPGTPGSFRRATFLGSVQLLLLGPDGCGLRATPQNLAVDNWPLRFPEASVAAPKAWLPPLLTWPTSLEDLGAPFGL